METDVVVVGAGVVGLAIAAELSRRLGDNSIILVERHGRFGRETSSRNSEVIHAGIYYPTGSLKARLCVEGNRRLYDFCREWGISHRRTGKLIVARDEEEAAELEKIRQQGLDNGVLDLEMLDQRRVSEMEPCVKALAAVLSPSTGIVDTHGLMARMEWSARQQGVVLAYQHEVIDLEPQGERYRVVYRGPGGEMDSVVCRWLINSAGLAADRVASWMGIDVEREGYRIFPCKGEYFVLSSPRSRLITSLIYPPPLKGLKSLGIHATKTLDGRLRFGPNAFYVDSLDYGVDAEHAREFYEAARSYMPFLELSELQPDMAGIRPKLQAPGEPFRDFIIRHESDRGLKGAVNLVGIESPGLTSCLSIANLVGEMVEKNL